jgi:hypothetical protein
MSPEEKNFKLADSRWRVKELQIRANFKPAAKG